jgi:tetratricopeptide (TPR) repeat protein
VRAAWLWAAEHRQYAALSAVIPALNLYFERRGQYVEGEMMLNHAAGILRQQPATPQRSDTLGELLALQGLMAANNVLKDTAVRQILEEGQDLLQHSTHALAQALLAQATGIMCQNTGKAQDARPYLQQAVDLYRANGRKWALAYALIQLAATYWYRTSNTETDFDQAQRLLTEARSIHTELGNLHGQAISALQLGTVASYMGNDEEDERLTSEALELLKQVNDPHNIASALSNMGVREFLKGNYDKARPYLEQGYRIRSKIGNPHHIGWSLYLLGRVAFSAGKFSDVISYCDAGLPILKADIHKGGLISLLCNRAEALRALGRYHEALHDYEQAGKLTSQKPLEELIELELEDLLYIYIQRAYVAVCMRDAAKAIQWLEQAQAQAVVHQLKTAHMLSQMMFAQLALQGGQIEQARSLLAPTIPYFTTPDLWQMSYAVNSWQMSAYAIDVLLLQAQLEVTHTDARAALAKALHTAQSIRSAAHLLSIAAAAAICIDDWPAQVIGWLSCVVNHPSAYAVDKVRASMALQKAANQHLLPDAQFAEICFAAQQMSIEQLTSELSAQFPHTS